MLKLPDSTLFRPSRQAAYVDLFDKLLDCAFLLDPHSFIILEANPACERILGISEAKMRDLPLSQWVNESERSIFEKELRVTIRRYHPRIFEVSFSKEEGKAIPMEVLACSLRITEELKVLQIIAKDISFRRKAELQTKKLLEELRTVNEKLEYLCTVDELTGLYNFRQFRSYLQMEHARATRNGKPYAVVFCDLDHFKNYNDHNGHPAGDTLLCQFSQLLKKVCRTTDLISRYGGEEFVIICPSATIEGATTVAERIRSSVEEACFLGGKHQPLGKVTVSVGIASYPQDGSDPEIILKRADEALYFSKRAGRNRVSLASQITSNQRRLKKKMD